MAEQKWCLEACINLCKALDFGEPGELHLLCHVTHLASLKYLVLGKLNNYSYTTTTKYQLN